MIRAAAALVASSVAAQADLPSPLFCITTALCSDPDSCEDHRSAPPFVLRQTDGEWFMVVRPRSGEIWVTVGETATQVLANAPEGVRFAMVASGTSADGRLIVHEHLLDAATLSPRFARHLCQTEGAAS